MERSQKPDHEIRRGNVRATIWRNQFSGRRVWYSVTISRLYAKGAHVQATGSLRFDDLMDARKVLRRAHFWIWWHGGAPSRKRW